MCSFDEKYEKYSAYCEYQSKKEPNEWDFKSNEKFTYMTEHVSELFGHYYMDAIREEFQDVVTNHKEYIIRCIQKNDKYGKTIKYNYPYLIRCSPTNLRYIYQSFKIYKHILSLKVDSINFVEIGGGYGGLCYYLYCLADIFGIKINKYTIFDLKKPALLLNKYLHSLNIYDVCTSTLDEINEVNLGDDNFLVSSYAFSELLEDNRTKYQKQLIEPHVKHGFIAWNAVTPYNITNNETITIHNNFYSDKMNQSNFVYITF